MARSQRFFALLILGTTFLAMRPIPPAVAEQSFLTGHGAELLQDGLPFRFTGINMYDANSDGWCGPDLQTGTKLSDALDGLGPGKNTVRAWFFQSLAINKDTHLRDWTAFDHTLDVVAAHGMRVIPTLTDQWGECGDGRLFPDGISRNSYKTKSWYETGYTETQPGFIAPYKDFVREVATRYANDKRVLFWQLINEAEIKDSRDGDCPPGNTYDQILKSWASDTSSVIRSVDQNHLISLGTIGGGQCGAQSDQYSNVHDVATIDLCEYHDYDANQPVPGDQWNGLARRIEQCGALGKPLFVGETGVKPSDVGGTVEDRAAAFDAKLGAQFRAGIKGLLAWAYIGTPTTLNNFDIGPGEPVLDVLALGPTTTNELVSQSSSSVGGNQESGNAIGDVSVSRDGRLVSFSSRATNLAGPDTNGTIDVFVRDRALGTTTLQSMSSNEVQGTDFSYGTALSGTGRFLAFSSNAANLVAGDSNGAVDLFVRDLIYGTTVRANVASDGSQASVASSSAGPDFSANGRYLVFYSDSAGLVPDDNNRNNDVFLRDRDVDDDQIYDEPGAVSTRRISVAETGGDANGSSGASSISPSGRFIAFFSLASNIVTPDEDTCLVPGLPGDPPEYRNCGDVFLLDRDTEGDGVFDETGATELRRVSEANGQQGNGTSATPDVSDTGDVVFWSQAENLGATPGQADAFVYDRSSGQLEIVGRVISNLQSISDDGRYVAFDSFRSNGVVGDQNNSVDAFIHDRVTGSNQRVSVNTGGAEVAYGGVVHALSGDGRIVAFASYANNLVPNDTNGFFDVFVRDRLGPVVGAATSPGSDVPVQPVDPISDQTADVTFDQVIQPGITTLSTTEATVPPPAGFALGDTYFDLSSTAVFEGSVEVCFPYEASGVPDESALRLFHYDSETDQWSDVTTSLDTSSNRICGSVTSFSPFGVGYASDTAAPVITISSPENGSAYVQKSTLTATYSCDDGAGSGVASCAGDAPNGAALSTATVGTKTFTVRARDNAGNSSSRSVTYSIIYRFQGFFSPVSNPPAVNEVRSGASVSVPFSLTGNQGTEVMAPATRSRALSCSSLQQTGQATKAQGKLAYAAKTDRYTYSWTTDAKWKGTCRVLIVVLKDGTEHLAYFKFR